MPYRKFNDKGYGEKPVAEGQTYDVIIEGIGSKGDGIGKIQGFVLVIPGVKKGDNVKVKVNAVRGKVAFAEVVGQGEAKPETQEAASEETDSEASDSGESEESSEEAEPKTSDSEEDKDSEEKSDEEAEDDQFY